MGIALKHPVPDWMLYYPYGKCRHQRVNDISWFQSTNRCCHRTL